MQTFLSSVIDSVILENKNLSSCTFILPSKRAGVFLKHELKKKLNQTLIFPTIISIEDFIGELSSLSLLDNTTLLFEFYTVYLNNTPKKGNTSNLVSPNGSTNGKRLNIRGVVDSGLGSNEFLDDEGNYGKKRKVEQFGTY